MKQILSSQYIFPQNISQEIPKKELLIHQKNDILIKSDKNAFSKHLQIFHPDHIREPMAFKLKVESTHSKCLERQVKERVFINNSEADHVLNSNVLNSKAEYHQPAIPGIIIQQSTRENRHGS